MNEWFKEWFSSDLYLEVYHKRNLNDARTLLNTLLSFVDIKKGDIVLDAACGAGRYSYLLAEKGFDVFGFDLSKNLLNIAKKNADDFSLGQKFICADIRSFCVKARFNAIFNLFTSFGYFDNEEENFLFVKNSPNFLAKGGYFVIDFLNSNYVIKNLIPVSQKNINGKTITEKRSIIRNRVMKEIEVLSDESVYNFRESVALYSYDKILSKFEDSGYELIKLLGDYKGSKFDKDISERFIGIFKLC